MVKCLTSPHVPGHHQSHMGHMTVTWRSHDGHMTVTWAPVLGCLRTRGQLHLTSVQVVDTCETVCYDPVVHWRVIHEMDLIKDGWQWLTFLLHRLNTITTNHRILHTPFMAPSASLWRWWTCKTKRPAWTQEYSVHFCAMLNNVELWHTVVITIQFQCQVVSADCTCKMELLLPVRMQNLPIKSGHEGPRGPSWSQKVMAHLQRDRQAALCQPATGHSHRCHSTRSDLSQTLRLIISNNLAKHFISVPGRSPNRSSLWSKPRMFTSVINVFTHDHSMWQILGNVWYVMHLLDLLLQTMFDIPTCQCSSVDHWWRTQQAQNIPTTLANACVVGFQRWSATTRRVSGWYGCEVSVNPMNLIKFNARQNYDKATLWRSFQAKTEKTKKHSLCGETAAPSQAHMGQGVKRSSEQSDQSDPSLGKTWASSILSEFFSIPERRTTCIEEANMLIGARYAQVQNDKDDHNSSDKVVSGSLLQSVLAKLMDWKKMRWSSRAPSLYLQFVHLLWALQLILQRILASGVWAHHSCSTLQSWSVQPVPAMAALGLRPAPAQKPCDLPWVLATQEVMRNWPKFVGFLSNLMTHHDFPQ